MTTHEHGHRAMIRCLRELWERRHISAIRFLEGSKVTGLVY